MEYYDKYKLKPPKKTIQHVHPGYMPLRKLHQKRKLKERKLKQKKKKGKKDKEEKKVKEDEKDQGDVDARDKHREVRDFDRPAIKLPKPEPVEKLVVEPGSSVYEAKKNLIDFDKFEIVYEKNGLNPLNNAELVDFDVDVSTIISKTFKRKDNISQDIV